ncbi:hypothetical protein Mgra_00009448 [Meloidogyne graminicola]|uniref:Uncharacterized protein n=1 Tax=Meloidogyne graminicola TaxID=189291 RepID=A0A8S9ZDB7_9BILA|nr:hypothetical protein Mgra_00009448 [Meloidogyne graminicola]
MNILILFIFFINNYIKIFSISIENNKIQSSFIKSFGDITRRTPQSTIINQIKFNKINKNFNLFTTKNTKSKSSNNEFNNEFPTDDSIQNEINQTINIFKEFYIKYYKYKNFEDIYKASTFLMNESMREYLLVYLKFNGINSKRYRQIIQLFYFFDFNENGLNLETFSKMEKIRSRMSFWAINLFLLNLYAMSSEEIIQKIRKNFYNENNIDIKLLLRKQIEGAKSEEEKEYIKLGVIGVTKYLFKQIYKYKNRFIGGGCFEHFGRNHSKREIQNPPFTV